MSAILGYKEESVIRDGTTASRLSELIGVDASEWRIVLNSTIRGNSQILHYFDIVMESNVDKSVIPIVFIKSDEENISSKIMLHKVKCDDVSSRSSFILSDYPMKARDKLMCEMCHIKAVDIGQLVRERDSNPALYDAFYGKKEPESKPEPAEIYSGRPKLFTRKNRDRTKIVQDVLENVLYMKSASVTQLIYKCNLNYKTARSLLNDMISKNLLKVVEYSSIGKRYELTDKGRKTIEKFQSLMNL